MMRYGSGKRLFLGLIVALILLYFSFRNVDFRATTSSLRDANLYYLFSAVILVVLGFFFRAYRWNVLLNVIGYKNSFADTLKMFGGGMFLNATIPGRAGDIYRIFVAKKRDMNRSQVLSTIYIEHLMDIFVLFTFVLITIPLIAFRAKILNELITYSSILLFLLIAVIIIGVKNKKFAYKIIAYLPFKKYKHSILEITRNIVAGFEKFEARKIIYPLFLSFFVWLFDIAIFYLTISSVGLVLSTPMYVFLLSSALLLMVLPITPSGLGVVEFYMQSVLGATNLSSAAIITYRSVNFLTLLAVSFFFFSSEMKD